MFNANIAAMVASAEKLEAFHNAFANTVFLEAARQWALQQKVDLGPAPVAPFKKIITVNKEICEYVESFSTTERVSEVDPRSFLPKIGTDVEGSDSPIGAAILGIDGGFHVSSRYRPTPGEFYPPGNPTHQYVQHSPIFGYWLEIK